MLLAGIFQFEMLYRELWLNWADLAQVFMAIRIIINILIIAYNVEID